MAAATITIPKKEYDELLEARIKYEYVKDTFEKELFVEPPTRSSKEILKAFKDSGLYSKEFLTGLSKGMKESKYFF